MTRDTEANSEVRDQTNLMKNLKTLETMSLTIHLDNLMVAPVWSEVNSTALHPWVQAC